LRSTGFSEPQREAPCHRRPAAGCSTFIFTLTPGNGSGRPEAELHPNCCTFRSFFLGSEVEQYASHLVTQAIAGIFRREALVDERHFLFGPNRRLASAAADVEPASTAHTGELRRQAARAGTARAAPGIIRLASRGTIEVDMATPSVTVCMRTWTAAIYSVHVTERRPALNRFTAARIRAGGASLQYQLHETIPPDPA